MSSKNAAGPHRKPRADVYTVLLVIALIGVIAANVFLYFIGADYDHDYKAAPTAPRVVQLQQFDGNGPASASVPGCSVFV